MSNSEQVRTVISKSAKRKMSSMLGDKIRKKADGFTEMVIYKTIAGKVGGKTKYLSRTAHEKR